MATVGTVIIDVKADTSKLVSGMDNAEKKIKKTVSSIQTSIISMASAYLGIQGVKAFTGMINDSIDAADATGKLAVKLGLTTEKLSEYQYAAGFAAVSNNELSSGIGALTRRLNNFQTSGGGAGKKGFEALGISAEYAKKNFTSMDIAFEDILKRLEKMPDSYKKTAIAQDIFSKSASGILRLTGTDLEKFSKEAQKLGLSISSGVANMAAAYHDQMDSLNDQITGLERNISFSLLPTMNAVSKTSLDMFSNMFGDTTEQMKTFENVAVTSVSNVAYSIGFIKDAFDGIDLVLETSKLGFLYLVKGITDAFNIANNLGNSIIEKYNSLPELLRGEKVELISLRDAESVQDSIDATKLKMEKLIETIEKASGRGTADEFVKRLKVNLATIKTEAIASSKVKSGKKGKLTTDNKKAEDDLDNLNAQKKAADIIAALQLVTPETDKINDSFLTMYDLMEGIFNEDQMETFFKKWNKELGKVTEDQEKYEGIGSKDWTSGLTGQAKEIANIGNAFADLGEEQEKWNKFSEDGKETEEDKNSHLNSQIGLYGNISGAMSNMYEEGSKGAQAANTIQGILAITQGAVAIIGAGMGDPYTAIPRMLAMAATVASVLGNAGISGGGGSAAPTISGGMTAEQNIAVIEAEYGPMTDRLDRQIDLLESIDRNGSAGVLKTDLAAAEFARDYAIGVQETLAGGTLSAFETLAPHMFENREDNYIQQAYNRLEAETGFNIVDTSYRGAGTTEGITTVDTASLAEGYNFIELVGKMAQAGSDASLLSWLFDAGWEGSGLNPGEFGTQQMNIAINDFQEYTASFTSSLVESVQDLEDAAGGFEDNFDAITGSMFFENKRLKQAFEDTKKLQGDNSLEDYLISQIDNISELSNVFTSEFNTLLNQNPEAIGDQLDSLRRLEEALGITFSAGAEEALNFIESIDLVSEALAASRENISSFQDSFKTDFDLLAESAINLGVPIVKTNTELKKLFEKLQGGIGGLTNKELEFLDRNKTYIESLEESTDATEDNTDATEESTDALNDKLDALKEEAAIYTTSSKNIESFVQSFLNKEERMNRLSSQLGIETATSFDGLTTLFKELSTDADGLTDSEMSLISANKLYLDSLEETDTTLSDLTNDISILESALSSIGDIIDQLSGSVNGGQYYLSQFYTTMDETLSLAASGSKEDFAESLSKTIGYSSQLLEDSNFSSASEMEHAQKVALNQFKLLENSTLDSLDYLEIQTNYLSAIETNTRNTYGALIGEVQAIADRVLASNALTSGLLSDSIKIAQDTEQSKTEQSKTEQTDTTSTNPFLENWLNTANGTQSWTSSGGAYSSKLASETDAANVNIYGIDGSVFSLADATGYVNNILSQLGVTEESVGMIRDKAAGMGISSNSLDALMQWETGTSMSFVDQYPNIQPFANGGIVTAPTIGLIGEAGYNEAVIPLKDPNDPLQMNALLVEIKEMKTEMKTLTTITEKQAEIIRSMNNREERIYRETP